MSEPTWLPRFQEDPSRLLRIVRALLANPITEYGQILIRVRGDEGPTLVIGIEPADHEDDDTESGDSDGY